MGAVKNTHTRRRSGSPTCCNAPMGCCDYIWTSPRHGARHDHGRCITHSVPATYILARTRSLYHAQCASYLHTSSSTVVVSITSFQLPTPAHMHTCTAPPPCHPIMTLTAYISTDQLQVARQTVSCRTHTSVNRLIALHRHAGHALPW